MAKFSASVEIKAKSNLPKIADEANNSFTKIGKGASRASHKMDKFGASVARVGKRLAAFGVVAGGAILVQGAKFETQLKDLSALTGLTGDKLKFAAEEALILSKRYGIAAGEILGAVKLVGSARSELLKQPTALIAIAEQALILSKAARIDLATAVEAVTTSMNQFELATEDSTRVINVLAAGAKVGASEIFDTATAISRAGVAMKTANVSFEQGNALIQVMAKRGIKAERAGTQLKTALLKLSTSGIDAISPQIVGLNTALENLGNANLDAAALTDLFGLEAFNVGKIMIDNRKLVADWTKEITRTSTAAEQAATNMDTFAETSKRLRSRLSESLINAFQSETFTKMLTQLDAWLEKTDALSILFDTIAESIVLIGKFLTPTGRPETIAGGINTVGATAIDALDVGGVVNRNAPQKIVIDANFKGLPSGASVGLSSSDDVDFYLELGNMFPAN